jgi:hypothetical protein
MVQSRFHHDVNRASEEGAKTMPSCGFLADQIPVPISFFLSSGESESRFLQSGGADAGPPHFPAAPLRTWLGVRRRAVAAGFCHGSGTFSKNRQIGFRSNLDRAFGRRGGN